MTLNVACTAKKISSNIFVFCFPLQISIRHIYFKCKLNMPFCFLRNFTKSINLMCKKEQWGMKISFFIFIKLIFMSRWQVFALVLIINSLNFDQFLRKQGFVFEVILLK